ncbi:unnamed protein product, partial [Dibothriocephalus latus]
MPLFLILPISEIVITHTADGGHLVSMSSLWIPPVFSQFVWLCEEMHSACTNSINETATTTDSLLLLLLLLLLQVLRNSVVYEQRHIVRYGDFIGSVVDHELHYILRFSDGARIRVHETAVNCFKLREAIPSDWSGDEFYEGTVISGDARSLAYRAPEAIVRWHTADSKSAAGRTHIDEEVDFLPFFLNETAKHNAIWLAGLRRRTKVDLLVEEMIPIRAKFHMMETDVKDTGSGRPSTILGTDLQKLQSIHPYPWSFCSIRDIFQYTLRPEDKLYDMAHFGNLEGLFYRHMTGQDLTSAQFHVSSSQAANNDSSGQLSTDSQPKASPESSKPSPYHVPLN